MYRKLASTFLGLLLVGNFFLIAPTRTLAQIGGTGSIQGIITDATGAVISRCERDRDQRGHRRQNHASDDRRRFLSYSRRFHQASTKSR